MKQRLGVKATAVLAAVSVVHSLARQKFIGQLSVVLLQRRNAHFGEVARHLSNAVKVAPHETLSREVFRAEALTYRG